MLEKTINNFILNASHSDVLNYKKQGKTPIIETYEQNQWSYIVEIMLVTIKSLKPCQEKGGNIVDYKRFKDELDLWKSYRHGMNKSLLYSMDKSRYNGYFTEVDESIYGRISVITIVNQNWEIIKSEIIKNMLFTTGNIEDILECILLSKILFLILKHKHFEYEDIIKEIKEEIIKVSPSEINIVEKSKKIEFERIRIKLINVLNDIDMDNRFEILKSSLNLLKMTKEYENEHIYNFFIEGLKGIINDRVESRNIKDISFLENLCTYMVKLRKGRITLDDLKIEDKKIVDIFSFKEKDIFFHPLLNTSQVLYKDYRDNFEIVYIKTKTGIYRFVRANKK